MTPEQNKQGREGMYNAAAISVRDLQGIATGFIYWYDGLIMLQHDPISFGMTPTASLKEDVHSTH